MKKLLTLLFLLPGFACFAQKVSLTLNLKKDSTYYLKTNADLTVSQHIQGQDVNISTVITGVMSHKVTAVTDTVYDMEVRYVSMSMHLGVAGQSMDFDGTDKSKTDPFSKILGSMMDKPFNIQLSNKGRVISVKNMDNLYNSMMASFPEITEQQKAQFKTQMEQSFGEKAIRSNFQDAFAMLPQKKIGVNDQWTANTKIESGLSADIATTYTLKEITGNAYVIHGNGTLKTGGDGNYKPMNNMFMRFTDMDGSISTNLSLDKTTCWIVDGKITKSIKATASIKQKADATPAETMTYPMSISAVIGMSK